MLEISGDIFQLISQDPCPYNMLLVPTNGAVDRFGNAIMGAGFAKSVKDLVPETALKLGTWLTVQRKLLMKHPSSEETEPWNFPYRIGVYQGVHLFSFPTKSTKVTVTADSIIPRYRGKYELGQQIDGWMGVSQLPLIERSAKFIAELVNQVPLLIERVILPRVGTGEGALDWETEVKPILDKYWDDRYTVVERMKK